VSSPRFDVNAPCPGNQNARDRSEISDGTDEHVAGAIDHVDRVVRGVGQEEPARSLVERRVAEAASSNVCGRFDLRWYNM